MQLTDTLLHALLVACDQSYNLSPTQNQPLAPYLDTPNGDPAIKKTVVCHQFCKAVNRRVNETTGPDPIAKPLALPQRLGYVDNCSHASQTRSR